MGAFISLPATTLLALPLLNSYSTSFNLLFFTLNWYLLLFTHSVWVVELYGLLAVRLLCYLIPAIILFTFDTFLPSLAEPIKERGSYALTTRLSQNKRWHVFFWSTANTLGGVGLTLGLEVLFKNVLRTKSLLNVGKQLPFPWSALQAVLWGVALRGILQYLIHRYILHNSKFQIAKLHRQWQHSIAAPFSLVATYDHPVAYLLHQWVPLYVPAFLFRTHLLPFLIILMIASFEDLMTYSGYSVLPSAILVKGMARRVDLHFLSKGKGNYAAFGAIDWICGTGLGKPVTEDLQQEWDKHNMDDKVQDGVDKGTTLASAVGAGMKGFARPGKRNGNTS